MKYNLLVPLAGSGTRMAERSTIPKPLVLAGNKSILDWSMDSIDYSECNLIFVILTEQEHNYSLGTILQSRYPGCNIVMIDQATRGAVETCYAARDIIRGDTPLIVYCPDVAFTPQYVPDPKHFLTEGFLLTFKANSTNYSYVRKKNGVVSETREKVIISQDAAVGVYCFKSGDVFNRYATVMIESSITDAGEFFLCPMYNLLIADKLKVLAEQVNTIHIMGTVPELEFFERVVYPYIDGPTEFVLCADHSGFVVKDRFKKLLLMRKLKVTDCGAHTTQDSDYYDFLSLARYRLEQSSGAYGVGFCMTGQGMNISANKIPGIRAALVKNKQYAELAVQHNAANFFSIPADEVGVKEMNDILDGILGARFQGGRHQNRIQKVGDV